MLYNHSMVRKGLALAVLIFAARGAAHADGPPLTAYAPLKVVALMPDTGQVMFYDAAVGEYRIAKVGETIEGWRVMAIAPNERRVTVGQGEIRDDLELTRLPRPGAIVQKDDPRKPLPVATPVAPAAPVAVPVPAPAPAPVAAPGPAPIPAVAAVNDPFAAAAPPEPMPLDPYGAPPSPPRAQPVDASEPIDPYEQGPSVTPQQPTVIEVAPESPPMVQVERRTVRRSDLERELNDFDHLMAAMRVTSAPGGGFIVQRLEPRSWPASLGLRPGDVVRSVAGERVSSVEDAARVYARVRSLSSLIVEIERGPQRVVLQIDVR
jgi:hypothetical protein